MITTVGATRVPPQNWRWKPFCVPGWAAWLSATATCHGNSEIVVGAPPTMFVCEPVPLAFAAGAPIASKITVAASRPPPESAWR